jgi:hypothetical protein
MPDKKSWTSNNITERIHLRGSRRMFGAQPSAPALPIIEKWAVEVVGFGVLNLLFVGYRFGWPPLSTSSILSISRM